VGQKVRNLESFKNNSQRWKEIWKTDDEISEKNWYLGFYESCATPGCYYWICISQTFIIYQRGAVTSRMNHREP